jgi:ATP-dependent Clp protease ATP-binding subunit ClpX
MDGIALNFEDAAFEAIAKLAIERNTGARGLRSIIEGFMMRPMYEFAGRNDIEALTVTEAFVKGLEDINIKYRKNTEALPEADASKKAV